LPESDCGGGDGRTEM